MQFEVVFLLLFTFISSSLSAPHREGLPLLNPGGIGGIFEGPGDATIIIGPDGSEITSEQKGGAVIQDDSLSKQPIVVAEAEVPLAPTAPILTEERLISAGPVISSTAAPILFEERLISAGPIISSTAGPILTDERLISAGPIIYSTGAPILASAVQDIAYAAPAIAPVAPILASARTPLLTGEVYVEAAPAPVATIEAKPIEIIEQDPHIIETEIIDAPDVEPEQSSDLKGPSGRVITKGSASIISGPASTTITEPRKIIVAPPKIAVGTPVIATATIPLNEIPLPAPLPAVVEPIPVVAAPAPLPAFVESLPAITASTIAPLPELSYQISSTAAPPAISYSTTAAPGEFSYSTTAAPIEYGYSTTAAPLLASAVTGGAESTKIDLGVNDYREYIPVVEYAASNGVLPPFLTAANAAAISTSSEIPLVPSTVAEFTTDKFAPSEGPAFPAAYPLPSAAPQDADPVPETPESSTDSPFIQKIPRVEDSVAIDGRVDMEYVPYAKSNPKNYQLPHVLGMALSRFYRKTPIKPKETITIDDKLGELRQNEITSYESRPQFLAPPNLSQSKYVAPALARTGIDASQVNLAPVPLSQVTRLPNGAYYQKGYFPGYSKRRRSN